MHLPAVDRRKSWGATALAVVLGIATGFALRGRESMNPVPQVRPAPEVTTKPASSATAESQTPGTSKRRSRSTEDGQLSFSRKQWRELQRNRSALQINLTDCLLWQRTIETPVENDPDWGSDSFTMTKTDGGPDLGPISAFLGLDDSRREKLRGTLQRFGERLREIEQENARLEYAGDGTARIDFGNENASRRKVFDQLDLELVESLGSRDASRFSAATGLVPTEALAEAVELRVSRAGDYLRVATSGSSEVLIPRDDNPSISPELFLGRLQHLGLDLDWDRLFREAREEAPK